MQIKASGMFPGEKCMFCGENDSDAVWNGESSIFICKRCALDKLPQLMADAIVGGADIKYLKKAKGATNNITHENYILKRFYSAFSSALLIKLREEESK